MEGILRSAPTDVGSERRMVGRLGFAPSSRRLRAGTSLSKFATLVAVCKDRDTKAELNRRSQACEVMTGTGFRVAEELYSPHSKSFASLCFDYFGECEMYVMSVSSLSWLAFLRVSAGEPLLGKPGTGLTAMANHRRGHFQDRARQLTSSASGRAIL